MSGSGSISRDEFKVAMAAHPQFNETEIQRLFDQIDFGGQGVVSYNEFLAATLGAASGQPDEEQVRSVFERLDIDGDGVVTREDLLRALGSAVSDEEVDKMYSQVMTWPRTRDRSCLASRLSPLASHLSPLASRLSPLASRAILKI